jgi:hypothetical protein
MVLNAEPIGSIRLPNTNIVDLRVEKSIRLSTRQRVLVRANLYNVTNTNAIASWTVRSGPDFLKPTAITLPRIIEFSGSYSF